tara:strand:- start:381 stop:704 length:324 start_codon:yes stop_codon:yes gene_type:complete
MAIRHFKPAFSIRVEPAFSLIGAALFALIVVAALISGWQTFMDNIATLGPVLVTLSISLLFMGFFVAKFSGLEGNEVKSISFEAGLQNASSWYCVGLDHLDPIRWVL